MAERYLETLANCDVAARSFCESQHQLMQFFDWLIANGPCVLPLLLLLLFSVFAILFYAPKER